MYNLHLCYHLDVKKTLESKYHLKTAVLPFGFELNPDLYDELIKKEEILKTCFLGNPDATSVETSQFIVENGFSVDVYCHVWEATELANNKNVTIFDAQNGEDFWRKLRAYRAQLNIYRKHNIGSHNMRTFEVAACGGIQLAPFSEEQTSFFKEDEEIFFYRSNPELILQLNRLLKEDKAMIHKFRSNARLRSLHAKYSYKMRSKHVFTIFSNLLRNG